QRVAVGAPTTSPASSPQPGPTDEREDIHGGRGGGGGGGGATGTGGTGFVPAPPVLTIPTPTPTPTLYTRFHGRVLDTTPGAPCQTGDHLSDHVVTGHQGLTTVPWSVHRQRNLLRVPVRRDLGKKRDQNPHKYECHKGANQVQIAIPDPARRHD